MVSHGLWFPQQYYDALNAPDMKGVPVHCLLVAAIIVKAHGEKKFTRSIFNQIESIFHQILGVPRH